MNVAAAYEDSPFKLLNEYATDVVRTELKEHIAAVEAAEIKTYTLAKRIGCGAIYDSMYRINSAATHSTPRSLSGYVTKNLDGEIVELHRRPQMENMPDCLFALFDFLLTVRTAFDDLFVFDASARIEKLREQVKAVVKVE